MAWVFASIEAILYLPGHPKLVELKNGETYNNGHLVNCDTWMNIHLREVICISKDGDWFWRMPGCYIWGNTIKYLRVFDEAVIKRECKLNKREKELIIQQKKTCKQGVSHYLREREEAFEEENKKELHYVSYLREAVAKEMEQINLEMQKLDAERREINLDQEQRDNEWAELNNSIEELTVQRQKLEKQRELLHAAREEILGQIEQMKKLEDLKIAPNFLNLTGSSCKKIEATAAVRDAKLGLDKETNVHDGIVLDLSSNKRSEVASPVSAPLSWLKRCADALLESA
ncbi:hypothetical protein U1Q18_022647 [Sarracenia purpurea var. burkii]